MDFARHLLSPIEQVHGDLLHVPVNRQTLHILHHEIASEYQTKRSFSYEFDRAIYLLPSKSSKSVGDLPNTLNQS